MTSSLLAASGRQALVEQLLRRKGIHRASVTAIPARASYSPCDLSFAQQRLWLAARLHAHATAYHLAHRLRVEGALDLTAVRRGLDAVIARHEALRTSIVEADGEVRQHVHRSLRIGVPIVDLSGAAGARRDRLAVRAARAEAARPFDFARAPLLRGTIIRLGAQDHVLLFTLHHLIADGWSMGVLVREFSALYEGFAAGTPVVLPLPRVHYPDYAVWQRASTRGEVFEQKLTRLAARLADLPRTELPGVGGDRASRAGRRGRGESAPLPVTPALLAAVQAIARRAGTTAFVTWAAALAVWLHRYTGQRDLAIGTPVANRLQTDLEDVIGCFVNPLVLRLRIDARAGFDRIVRHAHDVSLDAFAHQDVPFEAIVERIGGRRDADATPLFRVACVLHNTPPGRFELRALRAEAFAAGNGTARYDLELNVWQSDDRLGGSMVYDAGLFGPGVIARLLDHLTALLIEAASDGTRPIDALPMLTAIERAQLSSWSGRAEAPNKPDADTPDADTPDADTPDTVIALIHAHVSQSPQAPAVVTDDAVWDYATLWRRAEAIAHALRLGGVERASPIGLCASRAPETIAALLAALMRGAVYVPLDVDAPPERVREQLYDAHARLVMTDGVTAAAVPASGLPVLDVHRAIDAFERGHARERPVPVHPADLAYIIYTSGSTGTSKGVMVTHGGLTNYVRWARDTYPLGPGSVTLFHTSLAFDLTVTSLLVPLAAGAAIRIVPDAQGVDGLVAAFQASHDLGSIKVTPPHLRALADLQAPSGSSGHARAFVIGGEALDRDLVDRWRTCAPDTRLFNEYGPTETVVGCCVHEIASDRVSAGPVPIGVPIANTLAYVTTPHGQLSPVEVEGELWIGGAGVARGYLGRPDLTADRFVPDAFGTVPGSRLYRTGDRARWRPDGLLEYLGRRDGQVKIRGHRVELGEIEAALKARPEIADAAVMVREDGLARLVAYVVGRTGTPLDEAALRGGLRARLPEHMIPGVMVTLPRLPLTAHGKIDRRRLPAPASAAVAGGEASRAPRTPIEELLAGFWANALGVERVGVDDDFFEAGGHSVLAAGMLSRVRATFGVELPLRALFEAPTVARLAVRVAEMMTSAAGPPRPPIVPLARDAAAPLSFAQQRLWFLHHLDPESGFLNVPAALRLRGPLSVAALRWSLAAVVERHAGLRATFAFEGKALAQRIQPRGATALPIVSLEALPAARDREDAARRIANHEARRPFDLACGPVFRARLLRLAPDEHVFVCVVHHIATDGWSNRILMVDLNECYHARVTATPPRLPALAITYADFATWQRAWLSPGEIERQLAYWREQLHDVSRHERLFPSGAHAQARTSRRRGSETIVPGIELTREIKALCRRRHVTLFMTLVAAFEVVLHAATRREIFAIGTDVAGRRDAAVERVVGCFLNQIVLRADLRGDPAFAELLARVRAAVLGADEHQDLPFEQVVQALQPRREAGHQPLVQVSVVFENMPTAEFDLPEVTIEPFGVAIPETQSALNLVLIEGSGGIVARVEYDADLFTPDAAAALLRTFERVLREAVADPGARVSTLAR